MFAPFFVMTVGSMMHVDVWVGRFVPWFINHV